MIYVFCADTMGKINLTALNEMMTAKAVKPKKPTVGSSSTLGATKPEVASIVEGLPL